MGTKILLLIICLHCIKQQIDYCHLYSVISFEQTVKYLRCSAMFYNDEQHSGAAVYYWRELPSAPVSDSQRIFLKQQRDPSHCLPGYLFLVPNVHCPPFLCLSSMHFLCPQHLFANSSHCLPGYLLSILSGSFVPFRISFLVPLCNC